MPMRNSVSAPRMRSAVKAALLASNSFAGTTIRPRGAVIATSRYSAPAIRACFFVESMGVTTSADSLRAERRRTPAITDVAQVVGEDITPRNDERHDHDHQA